MILIRYY